MFSFFKKKLSEVLQSGREDVHTPSEQACDAGMPVDEAFCPLDDPAGLPQEDSAIGGAGAPALQESAVATPQETYEHFQPEQTPPAVTEPQQEPESESDRSRWLDRLKMGLKRTGNTISAAFGVSQVDESLYEELESALLMADAGVQATAYLLDDLKRRVKSTCAETPVQVRALLADAVTDLLQPLQKPLVIGEYTPTVIMVAGVNGAGKTTTIGKLTRHLSEAGQSVLLAAADTFRAAAREQLSVWADRNMVEIVSSAGGDPAALSFDAVAAAKARNKHVVLVDTAGRLPTQLHLMDELKKIRRTISKACDTAPHEVLLVIDGNTGQNALAQVKAFDEALQLTGLIVTKLDGTAKGGVLCAIARERPVPVYFVGVGEKLEDLQTFNAREFSEALLG
jgi:fused signal recognition particle receptor